jgi:hypothetical protein
MLLTLLQLFTPLLSSLPSEITGKPAVESETISTNGKNQQSTAPIQPFVVRDLSGEDLKRALCGPPTS